MEFFTSAAIILRSVAHMSRYLLTAELLVAFTFIHLLGVGRKYVTSRRQFLYTSYIIVVTVSRVKVNRVTARVIYTGSRSVTHAVLLAATRQR